MAYIHVKRIGEKNYYTLRISVRENGRVVTKDIASLGSDLSAIKIDDLENNYRQEIRNSYKTIKRFLEKGHFEEQARTQKYKSNEFYTTEQLVRVEALKNHYQGFLRLPEATQNDFYDGFLLQFAVNSTSIEGNTITLKQAQQLFTENLVPKDKDLREVHDLTNTREVVHWLRNKRPPITIELVIAIHDLLLAQIDKRTGIRDHDIHIFKQPFKPTPARYVKEDLQLLLDWLNKEQDLHPLVLAALFHHKFESIHPFSDGNGRTGRVLMNHILHLRGYPPVVVSRRNRKEYLEAMNAADQAITKDLLTTDPKHYRKLLDFLLDEYVVSYWDNFLY